METRDALKASEGLARIKYQEPEVWDDLPVPEWLEHRLRKMCGVVKATGEVLGHLLFEADRGDDIKAVAQMLGKELGVCVKVVDGTAIRNPGDLAGVITSMERGDLWFLENIEAVADSCTGYLQTVLENFKVDIVIDEGPEGRSVPINLPRFAVVASTSSKGAIAPKLLEQFLAVYEVGSCPSERIATVLLRQCSLWQVDLRSVAAKKIAERAYGNMERAHKLLGWAVQCSAAAGLSAVDEAATLDALNMLFPSIEPYSKGRAPVDLATPTTHPSP